MPRPTHAEVLARPVTNHKRRVPNEVLLIRLHRRSRFSTTHSYAGVRCLEFTGTTRGGYGISWDGTRREGVHVISFKMFKGPLPEGHDVLHRCDNPACWEPTHLWSGTHRDNMKDKMRKGRGGHEKLRGRKRPGTGQRGIKHPSAKLTEKQARSILSAKPTGIKGTHLAEQYGVSPELVYGIWSGRNWGWLSGGSNG